MNNLKEVTTSFHEPDAAFSRIETALTGFDPISLSELADCTLQDRMDTKYVMGLSQLDTVLRHVTGQYRVLEIGGTRLNPYETLYFDTPDFRLYQQHHNGLASRYKIRARRYVVSDLSFFEVKHKTNQNRTIKSRLPIPDVTSCIDEMVNEFVDTHTPFQADCLEPKLWNNYQRITLVGKQRVERVTLDLNMEFSHEQATSAFPGIVIVEIKQSHLSLQSDFIHQMRLLSIHPMSFSKYTAGIYTLYDHVKTNNFKPLIRQVQKVMHKEQCHDYLS